MYLDVMSVCISRAVYLCFFALHFGVIRGAIPDAVKPSPRLEEVLPSVAKGLGAVLALAAQRSGVASNDTGLTVVMVGGSICCMMCHAWLHFRGPQHEPPPAQ
eukprot:SAG22_NODE_3259_length_1825_cov_1.280997_1_plen_103_part_00